MALSYPNFLKKVSRIKFTNGNRINFYYDATGTLLKRKLSNNDVWQYEDELILKNGQVYQINHEEGRVTYDVPTDKYTYEFEYRDIWGNLRLSFRDSLGVPVSGVYKPPVVVQASDFDAFGYEISKFNNSNPNNWKYQKQERIDEFGLGIDLFKFRPSDYLIGRFWQIDPLASEYAYNSPYALQENKFGRGIELEGKELAPFSPVFSSNGVLVRPVISPRVIPNSIPLRPSSPVILESTQKHHIIPNQQKDHQVVKEARQEGFKQDGEENKINVERYDKNSDEGRHGNHPEYNKEVLRKLTEFEKESPSRTSKEALDFVRKTVKELKETINNKPDTKINDLFKAKTVAPTDNTRVQKPVDKRDVHPCPGDPNCT
jgi:hypothetical protein